MSEKTIERNLGLSAGHLITHVLRGPCREKRFAWTGSKTYLLSNHEYTILGFSQERRYWDSLKLEMKQHKK